MTRPSPEERAERDARRKKNEAERASREAREQETYRQVKGLVAISLKRPRELIDIDTILTDLSEARAVALSCYPPQVGPAVNASLAQARLLGLIVDRQEIGKPQEFADVAAARSHEELMETLEGRLGPGASEKFERFMSEMRTVSGVIEHRNEGNERSD